MKRPGVALGLVIIMFGLEQFLQTRSAFFLSRSYVVNITICLVAGIAATNWLLQHKFRFAFDNIQVSSLLLIMLSFTSQFWTLAPYEFSKYYTSAIPYFLLFLVVAPIIVMDKSGVRTAIWTALYLGIPLVFLFVFLVDWEGRGIRLAAPVLHKGRLSYFSPPLALASMAAQVGLLSILLVPKNPLLKLIHFATFALACYVAFRTQSRGQLVAMGVITLVCYPLANQATKVKGVVITVVGLATLSLFLYAAFSFLDLGQMNRWNVNSVENAFDGRSLMIENLLTTWTNSSNAFVILFGLGSASSFVTSGFYVHNLPAEILGELGLVGACLFVFIYFQVAVKSLTVLRKLQHYPEMRREVVALMAFFMFSSIISLKQGSLFSWPHLFFYAIAIGHLERHGRKFTAQANNWWQLFILPEQTNHASQPTYR